MSPFNGSHRLYRCGPVMLTVVAVIGCGHEGTPLELAQEPASLVVAGGDRQIGSTLATLGDSVQVLVQDGEGRPVPAAEVRWTVERGVVGTPVDSTDARGIASVQWTLPSTPGTDRLTASVVGVGTTSFSASVQPIPGRITFRYLDAGSYHACGITTTEQLLCWGYNGDGQLGSDLGPAQLYPSLITGDERYRLVSGGRYHACAVTLAGQGRCWGNNQDGRLEVNTEPTYQQIQAGRVHSCALDIGQHLWCWGYNGEGQLGHGSPSPASGGAAIIAGDPAIRQVTTGGQHTCATTVGGVALCWGYDALGQLGDGNTASRSTAAAVSGLGSVRTDPTVVFPSPDPDFPLPVGPFLAAGFDHTCAIALSGTTFCWGLNQDGQIGASTRTTRGTAVAVSGGRAFVAVTAGLRHTCALTLDGTAFCWGDNTFGQLGDGTTEQHIVPTAVAGSITFAYLKAGDLSTCGITSQGVAYCWGDNEYGQLGSGGTASSSIPVKVAFQP